MKERFILLLLGLLIVSSTLSHAKWIRIYDRSGQLISGGHFKLVNDTALKIFKQGKAMYIETERIGLIVTGRTDGHNVGVSALVCGTLGMALGAASASDPDDFFGYTAGEGAIGGLFLGGAAGAAFGFLTTVAKDTKVYEIYGSMEALKKFQVSMKN